MTGKNSKNHGVTQYGKYEIEIEKLRDENKWNRLREFANGISTKDLKSG